jgi:glucokinase
VATVGVDLGGTKVMAAVVHHGKPHHPGKVPTPTDGPDAVVEAIAALIEETAEANDVEVTHVGIGAPGKVDREAGVLAHAPNLVGFGQPVALADLVAARLGGNVHVRLDNDVSVAALGEGTHGAAAGSDDFLAVWVGTGVGGGLILDGELRRGDTGGAGEIGHTTVWPEGRVCGCGGIGHLEAYAGRAALEAEARRRHAAGEPSALVDLAGEERMKSRIFAEALEAGDQVATALLDDAVRALGLSIASVVTVVDIDLVVIGGGLGGRLGDPFVARVERVVQDKVFGNRPVRLVTSTLLDYAGVVGAAELF